MSARAARQPSARFVYRGRRQARIRRIAIVALLLAVVSMVGFFYALAIAPARPPVQRWAR